MPDMCCLGNMGHDAERVQVAVHETGADAGSG